MYNEHIPSSFEKEKMAIHHQQQAHFTILDTLFCEEEEEEQWDDDDDDETEESIEILSGFTFNIGDLILTYDDEELLSLLSKERETMYNTNLDLSVERRSAVDWMIRVTSHYGFSALTAILAVDYLDRFVSRFQIDREKPWMIQLAAVTCLSLAAKVEETQVPLLLDFQVECAKYVFEAKTIQRMELLVLSTLEWKMNPVTPLSFIDHIIKRLGLKCHFHLEFFRQCETLLLSVLPDVRFVGNLPSVTATATMFHAIQQVMPCNHSTDYQNQLLCVFKLTWEKVTDCYQLMEELSNTSGNFQNKRKYERISKYFTSSKTDSNSGSVNTWSNGSLVTSSSSSSPESPQQKRIKPSELFLHVPSLSRVFVNVLGNP